MKYRSITLNGNSESQYSLIKYNDEYKYHLEELRKMNNELADYVENCPKIYSENSEEQSYMIMRDNRDCVGAIYISTSTDEKNLEIKVHFNEKYFVSSEHIVKNIEKLVESLGLYFYNKENIEIQLVNNIDLLKFNKYKFKKKIYDENLTTYIFSNEGNNKLIPALIDEINGTEKNLTDWKQFWMQQINLFNHRDLSWVIDEPLLEEYDKGTISLEEIFYKADSIYWYNIKSNKSIRNISFNRSGHIYLDKFSKNYDGIHYSIDYYVLNDGCTFHTENQDNNYFVLDENNYYTQIKTNNIKIHTSKETKKKTINYVSPTINKSSISIELILDEFDKIDRCHIDFRTHKGNGKINGLYALRINPGYYNDFSLNYISRNGIKEQNFVYSLPITLFEGIISSGLTFELVNEIINESIKIIKLKAMLKHRQSVNIEGTYNISYVMDIEKQIIDFIKQIKGEIPLPHLQENIEKFIETYSKDKVENKKKVLRK